MKQCGRASSSSLPLTERLAYLGRRGQRRRAAPRHSEVMSAGCEIGRDPETRSAHWLVSIEHFLRPCHRMIPSFVNHESDRKHDPSRSHLPAVWLGRRRCCYAAGLTSLFGELRTWPRGSWTAMVRSLRGLLPFHPMTSQCVMRCGPWAEMALARPLCVTKPLHQTTLTNVAMGVTW